MFKRISLVILSMSFFSVCAQANGLAAKFLCEQSEPVAHAPQQILLDLTQGFDADKNLQVGLVHQVFANDVIQIEGSLPFLIRYINFYPPSYHNSRSLESAQLESNWDYVGPYYVNADILRVFEKNDPSLLLGGYKDGEKYFSAEYDKCVKISEKAKVINRNSSPNLPARPVKPEQPTEPKIATCNNPTGAPNGRYPMSPATTVIVNLDSPQGVEIKSNKPLHPKMKTNIIYVDNQSFRDGMVEYVDSSTGVTININLIVTKEHEGRLQVLAGTEQADAVASLFVCTF